jgi:magnesium-transporting ATPase (P-type)
VFVLEAGAQCCDARLLMPDIAHHLDWRILGVTAEAIARRVGIITAPNPGVVSGQQLEAMSAAQLEDQLTSHSEMVFGRVRPEHKQRIVAAYQHLGEIVASVALGRSVYGNIRKFIIYIFSHNISETGPILLAAAIAFPLVPLSALQVLSIDLGSEDQSILTIGIFSNRRLLLAGAFGIALVGCISYIPVLQSVFGTADLSATDWLMLVGFGLALLLADECRKAIVRDRRSQPSVTTRVTEGSV